MNTISYTASALAHSFTYALLYSLWQGLLIYVLLYMLLKAFPGTSSRTRYVVSYSAFTAIALWFADTWASQYSKLKGVTVYISSVGGAAPAIDMQHAVPVNVAGPARMDIFRDYLPQLERYVPAIIILYCIGLTFMLLRFVVNLWQLQALQQRGIADPGAHWAAFVARWQRQLGIDRPVKLLLSSRVAVPLMLGAIKPVILLPVATISRLSTEQVEAILLHELAHIRRHDYLLNMIQATIETILFFNPFIWLVSSVIRREREHCCDDLVLSCSSNPMQYARALAMLEDNRINTNSLSLAATGNKNQLFHRIKRIMEMKKDNIGHGGVSAVLVAIIATTFLASMIAFTPSFAQKAKDEKKTEQKKTSTTKTVTIDDAGKKKVVTKTRTTGAGKHNNDDDVDINISIDNDDKKHATANVTVIATCDDEKGGGRHKGKKQIIFSTASAGGNFDNEEINREIAKAKVEMDKVDWDEVREEISSALAEVGRDLDLEKLAKEINIEIHNSMEQSKDDMGRARKDMDHARKDMDQAKKEMARSKVIAVNASGGKARASAKAGDDEVSTESNEIETMLEKMEKDGLINRSSKFRVEKEDGTLFINGEKQPAQVYEKYNRYLSGKEVTIKGSKGMLNVSVNN